MQGMQAELKSAFPLWPESGLGKRVTWSQLVKSRCMGPSLPWPWSNHAYDKLWWSDCSGSHSGDV